MKSIAENFVTEKRKAQTTSAEFEAEVDRAEEIVHRLAGLIDRGGDRAPYWMVQTLRKANNEIAALLEIIESEIPSGKKSEEQANYGLQFPFRGK